MSCAKELCRLPALKLSNATDLKSSSVLPKTKVVTVIEHAGSLVWREGQEFLPYAIHIYLPLSYGETEIENYVGAFR